MADYDVQHSLARIFVFIHEKVLAIRHAFPQILLCLWVLVFDVIVVLVIINKVYSIKVFVDKFLFFLRSIKIPHRKFRHWIFATKLRLFIQMLCEHVVDPEFLDTKRFTHLSTSHHCPSEG